MTATARALDQLVVPGGMAAQRTVQLHPALTTLFPQGLVRGSSVACQGAAAVSMAFVLAAAPTQADAWVGVAGLPTFGAQACRQMGTRLERVVLVADHPDGLDDDSTWAPVLGALIDGFDIVVFGAAHQIRAGTARRVQTRVQTRGAVLVLVGDPGPFSTDVRVSTQAVWDGLGDGAGHLRDRTVQVTVDGRRIPRARHDRLAMPGPSGSVESLTSGTATSGTATSGTASPAGAVRWLTPA